MRTEYCYDLSEEVRSVYFISKWHGQESQNAWCWGNKRESLFDI